MDQVVRIVVVGCGGISKSWFLPLSKIPEVRIVGLADLSTENARKRAEEFSLEDVVISDDYDALIGELKPDLVVDCTLPHVHRDVTLSAFRHGANVLGEKPLADTLEHAQEVVAAAETHKRVYAVMQNRRFDHNIQTVRRALDEGLIGRPHTFYTDFFIGAHFGGFRDEMKHVLLLDMAIHSFDQGRFLTQAEPVRVTAHEWNPPGSWYRHDASAQAFFQMTDEKIFTYRGSWCAEGADTSWQCSWRIIGTGGTLLWDGDDAIKIHQVVPDSEGFTHKSVLVDPPRIDLPLDRQGHEGCIRHFLEALAAGTEPETIASDNIKSLEMVHRAIESADTHQTIKF